MFFLYIFAILFLPVESEVTVHNALNCGKCGSVGDGDISELSEVTGKGLTGNDERHLISPERRNDVRNLPL